MSPDGSRPSPPEERLLKLIRGKSPRPAAGSIMPSRLGMMAAGAVVPHPLSVRLRQLPWPRIAVAVLGTVLVAEVGCLILQAVRPLPEVRLPEVSSLAPPEPAEAGDAAALSEMPSLAASGTRSLFTAPVVGPAGMQPASTMARSLASRLMLTGIISGEPAQAIIEDAETKRAHLVTVGQMVTEGAVVEQVLENRVILDLGGEKLELAL